MCIVLVKGHSKSIDTSYTLSLLFLYKIKDMLNAIGAALSAVTSFYALDLFLKKKEVEDSSTSTH